MRSRCYQVDDEDFQTYKQRGGSMSCAEFFNYHLGMEDKSDSKPGVLERKLADGLGAEPSGNLESRIRCRMTG